MATPKTPRKSADKSKADETLNPKDQGNAPATAASPFGPAPTDAAPKADDAKQAKSEPASKTVPPTAPDAPPAPKPTPAKAEPASADKSMTDKPVINTSTPSTKDNAEAPKPRDAAEPPKTYAKAPPPPPPEPKPEPLVVKNSPGFVPLVLGGIVAAGLGFALARYVVPEGWPVPGASPLQTQLTQQAQELQSLRAQLQALPKEDNTSTLLGEITAVRETATAALDAAEAAKSAAAATPSQDVSATIETLQSRLAAVENAAGSSTSVDPAVIARLTSEIDTLRSGLEAQKAAAEALVAEAETIRANAAAKAETVLLQAALTKVEAAIQNGNPFAEPLGLLKNAGVAVPETLSSTAETGVPTKAALATSFDEPARAALEAGLRGNMGSTWTDRVGSFLRSQTGARSLTPQDGTDPDAVLSRAGAAVAAGDLQAALNEIAALPQPAQDALSAWVTQAKLHLDAQTATATLATALSER